MEIVSDKYGLWFLQLNQGSKSATVEDRKCRYPDENSPHTGCKRKSLFRNFTQKSCDFEVGLCQIHKFGIGRD